VSKSGIYILIFIVPVLFFSCSRQNYQSVLKGSDTEEKLSMAKELYEKGECLKALPLFEEVIPIYKGTKNIDDIYYQYADCHFQQGDYLLASFHFKNIYDSYPLSPYAEECLYMNAYSHYMLSPEVPLDQTYTEKAIEHFQLFINSYPESEKVAESNKLIDQLRGKLVTKDFREAPAST
jgi:outer membrane protein assembly factor BamD